MIRKSKTVNGVSTTYSVLNGKVMGENKAGDTLLYLYDESGKACGLVKNGTAKYYFLFNAQGDVIGIMNQAGARVVSYEYGPWGELLSTTGTEATEIGVQNPFRYRGYYYDTETGFYDLQSRYYDPMTGRFLNADAYIERSGSQHGYNLYQYCNNNPIMLSDPTGYVAGVDDAVFLLFLTAVAVYSILTIYAGTTTTLPSAEPWGLEIPDLPMNPPEVQVPTWPSVDIPIYADDTTADISISHSKPEAIGRDESKEKPKPPKERGQLYYHVTTGEGAILIAASNYLRGCSFESGYVYAWKFKPSKGAVLGSGAHLGVLISFRTNASFVRDDGIDDPYVQAFVPVQSVRKGGINIWDVHILGPMR